MNMTNYRIVKNGKFIHRLPSGIKCPCCFCVIKIENQYDIWKANSLICDSCGKYFNFNVKIQVSDIAIDDSKEERGSFKGHLIRWNNSTGLGVLKSSVTNKTYSVTRGCLQNENESINRNSVVYFSLLNDIPVDIAPKRKSNFAGCGGGGSYGRGM